MRVETQCVQEGYKPENGQPRILPIYQSTTYKYDSAGPHVYAHLQPHRGDGGK